MRRPPSRFLEVVSLLLGTLATVVLAVGVVAPTAALAEDATPTDSADSAEEGEGADPNISEENPGTVLCTLQDDNLDNISGMVVTDEGILAVEAGDVATLTIHTIDAEDCSTTSNTYGINPVDPQDMAVASDGTIFVADIGTNEATRQWITLEQFTPGQRNVTAWRMTYPGNELPHAEAFLLDANDKPIIIAQDGASAGIYVPTGEMVADTTQNLPELSKVGEFTPQNTGTSNPMGQIGNSLVTGAAKSPDGSKVVIRTVSDAYEFEVGADGDIVKAITEGTPLVTRLPGEGSNSGAIAYSLDGESFLTLGKKEAGATENVSLLSYPRHQPPPDDPVDEGPPPGSGEKGFLDSLTFSELTRIVSAVGVVGLVLAIAGIVGIRRARRRRREEEEWDDYYDDDYDDDRRGRGRRGGRGGRGGRDGYGRGYGDYDEGYGYGPQGYDSGYADAGYGAGGYGADGYGDGYGGDGYAGAPG
ncbi:MAG TPA: hypothetical protein VK028_08575, partial [Micromonosporaceae bacterium]|nr:hypothetical protein [Micromonosporaceae bacterium]